MTTSGTVVRTYAASDRAAAERSYQRELREAATQGWSATSQRWRSEGREHVLTVTYEISADAAAAGGLPFAEAAARAVPDVSIPWNGEAARDRDLARLRVETLDLHCAGEPLRLVRSGFPEVPYLRMEDRRAWVRDRADHIRGLLMLEPRGHRDMVGALLLEPYHDDADIGILFMHDDGYGTMSGHAIIAITGALIEEGLYPATRPRTTIRWETPAGLVTATAAVHEGGSGEPVVDAVRFVNVPAYLHASNVTIRPRGVRLFGAAAERKGLSVQIAYGGAYYGIVDVAELGLRVAPEHLDGLTRAGAAITAVLRRDHAPEHPTEPSLGFIHGTIIVDSDPATAPDGRARGEDIRCLTVFADGRVDRSPNGSGTSAILAARMALGASEIGDEIVNAGITGESFHGRVESAAMTGTHDGVSTSVEGHGYVTGHHTFVLDERDPHATGFPFR